jgi:hypothetical protein
MCHEIAKTLVKSHNRVLQLTKLIKRMDQVLIETQNEVKALLKQRGELNKELSSTTQKRMSENSERASRVALEISSALGEVTGDIYGNVDFMDEYSAELLVRQGAAAAAADDADLKQTVKMMVKEHMLQEVVMRELMEEAELNAQVAASGIIQRPFCGPLPEKPEPAMMFGKRGRTTTSTSSGSNGTKDERTRELSIGIVQNTLTLQQPVFMMPASREMHERIELLLNEMRVRPDTIMTLVMNHATTSELREIQETIQSSNNLETRFSTIASVLFKRELGNFQCLKESMKFWEIVFNNTAKLAMTCQYFKNNGGMDWTTFSDDLHKGIIDSATRQAQQNMQDMFAGLRLG